MVPALAIEILPVGLTGLALAGILSVIMSTADSYLIVSVQTCVHDIYKVFNPNISEKKELRLTRVFAVILPLGALVIALYIKNAYSILMFAWSFYAAAAGLPAFAALYWKKATKAGIIAGMVAPASVALVGFLMFGNLLRECGVLNALSETAQNVLANLITLVLGLTVAGQMTADKFVRPDTLLILALGLVAFVFDTAGGVLFAKLLNLFLPEGKKLNPMIGAAGISAFPMSGRVVNKMGLEEDSQNFLLMYSISVNVSGQIASVIAGGLILTLMA